MRKTMVVGVVPILLANAIAGCGSSQSSSSAAGSQPGSTPAATASAPSSSSAPTSGSAVALITTKHAKLGTILAYGPKKLTVYLFEADKGPGSTCTGKCARVWPPVVGRPRASGGASSGDLGTMARPDGRTQVTYKGHPLYLYVKDKDDGDAYGQGIKSFGAGWYALKPSGEKLDLS